MEPMNKEQIETLIRDKLTEMCHEKVKSLKDQVEKELLTTSKED